MRGQALQEGHTVVWHSSERAPSHGQRCHLGWRAVAPSAGVSAPVGTELWGLGIKGNVGTDRVLA